MKYSIGVDIGGTKVKVVILDECKVIHKYELKTNKENNGEFIIKEIVDSICNYINNNDIKYEMIYSIGVGVPGPVVNDVVKFCVNLGWGEKNVVVEFLNLLPFKTFISCLNDANATIYAEIYNKYNSAVMVTLGTGIGGGIFNGTVLEGFNGSAGEIGHINVSNPYHFKCNCGLHNCFETVASSTGIQNIYKFKTNIDLDCKEIFTKAINNDTISLEVIEEVCDYIGRVCSILSVTINPEIIIIGGGVSLAGGFLLDKINYYFNKYSFNSVKNTNIILSVLKNDSGGIGVALYAKEKRKCVSKSET